MRRYALILTASALSLTLVADGFSPSGAVAVVAAEAVQEAGRLFRQPLPVDEPTEHPFRQSPFGTEHSTVDTSRSVGTQPPFGRAAVNTPLDTKPSFGRATVNTSVNSKSPLGREGSGHSSRGRNRHASLNSERRHPSQHRSRQNPERNRCPPRTAALDAGLVQARCFSVTQYAPCATDCQSTSCSTWRW